MIFHLFLLIRIDQWSQTCVVYSINRQVNLHVYILKIWIKANIVIYFFVDPVCSCAHTCEPSAWKRKPPLKLPVGNRNVHSKKKRKDLLYLLWIYAVFLTVVFFFLFLFCPEIRKRSWWSYLQGLFLDESNSRTFMKDFWPCISMKSELNSSSTSVRKPQLIEWVFVWVIVKHNKARKGIMMLHSAATQFH